MHNIQQTPNILKMKCAKAARRACALAVSAAILEVTVVPMFSPITNAIPKYKSSTPLEQRISVMAITAADDCAHMVMMPPINRKSRIESPPHSLQEVMKLMTAALCSRSICKAFSRRVVSPKNMNAKPKTNSPKDFFWLLLEKARGTAKANKGKIRLFMSIWKPKTDMIHAVTVVPILAPIITDMACPKVSKPAFTKLTVITVVAVEDCTEAVTNVPVSSPVKRFVVMAPST